MISNHLDIPEQLKVKPIHTYIVSEGVPLEDMMEEIITDPQLIRRGFIAEGCYQAEDMEDSSICLDNLNDYEFLKGVHWPTKDTAVYVKKGGIYD